MAARACICYRIMWHVIRSSHFHTRRPTSSFSPHSWRAWSLLKHVSGSATVVQFESDPRMGPLDTHLVITFHDIMACYWFCRIFLELAKGQILLEGAFSVLHREPSPTTSQPLPPNQTRTYLLLNVCVAESHDCCWLFCLCGETARNGHQGCTQTNIETKWGKTRNGY